MKSKATNLMNIFIIPFLFIFLIACSKNSGTPSPSNTDDPVGTYSGVIYTTINKTRTSANPPAPPILEKSTKVLTVSITKDGENYKLNNVLMTGGARVYYANSDGAFEFDIELKTIKYTFYQTRTEWIAISGYPGQFQYAVTEERDGLLKK